MGMPTFPGSFHTSQVTPKRSPLRGHPLGQSSTEPRVLPTAHTLATGTHHVIRMLRGLVRAGSLWEGRGGDSVLAHKINCTSLKRDTQHILSDEEIIPEYSPPLTITHTHPSHTLTLTKLPSLRYPLRHSPACRAMLLEGGGDKCGMKHETETGVMLLP